MPAGYSGMAFLEPFREWRGRSWIGLSDAVTLRGRGGHVITSRDFRSVEKRGGTLALFQVFFLD